MILSHLHKVEERSSWPSTVSTCQHIIHAIQRLPLAPSRTNFVLVFGFSSFSLFLPLLPYFPSSSILRFSSSASLFFPLSALLSSWAICWACLASVSDRVRAPPLFSATLTSPLPLSASSIPLHLLFLVPCFCLKSGKIQKYSTSSPALCRLFLLILRKAHLVHSHKLRPVIFLFPRRLVLFR